MSLHDIKAAHVALLVHTYLLPSYFSEGKRRVMLAPALLCIAMCTTVYADVYLHSMRGSNNRLNGNGRERRNANRLFDSQNNNRGGYNVGPGYMYYYTGSILSIEWTNQHECGGSQSNCDLILQYMCSDNLRDGTITK